MLARDTLRGGLSTMGGPYPQGGMPYPQRRTGSLRVERFPEGVDIAAEIVVLAHLALDLLAAVEDGRMVAAAEGLADPEKRRLGLFAHQVHRDLARQHDLLVPGLAAQLIR